MFTEEEIDGLIKLDTFKQGEDVDLHKLKEFYHKQVGILTKQIFYAIEKGIDSNELNIIINEGCIRCSLTVKTAPHKESNLLFLENGNSGKEESDNAKHMTI